MRMPDVRDAIKNAHAAIMRLLDAVEDAIAPWRRTDDAGRLKIAETIRDHRKAVRDAWSEELEEIFLYAARYIETCIELCPPEGDLNQRLFFGASSAHAVWAEASRDHDCPPEQQHPGFLRVVSGNFIGLCRRGDDQVKDKPSLLELRNELEREYGDALRSLRSRPEPAVPASSDPASTANRVPTGAGGATAARGDARAAESPHPQNWDHLLPKQQAVIAWMLSQERGKAFTRGQILEDADGIHDKGDDRVVLDQLITLGIIQGTGSRRKRLRLASIPARVPSTLPRHASWADS